MPEPEHGYASIMKNSDAYRRFFAFLSQEHYLDMLVLAYRVPGERNFTADFASRQLGIEESEAERILDHMYQTRMLQRSEIRLADRILYAYARHDETLIVPFLYFAGELMHNSDVYYSLPMRAEPIFKAPLGTDSLSPDWCDDAAQKELELPFGAGYTGV